VGEIFIKSSTHLVFAGLTIHIDLATTKISSEISYEYDVVRGELIRINIIFN